MRAFMSILRSMYKYCTYVRIQIPIPIRVEIVVVACAIKVSRQTLWTDDDEH